MEERNPIFLKGFEADQGDSVHYDVIKDVLFQKLEKFRMSFLGFIDDALCYKDKSANDVDKLVLFKYNKESNTLNIHKSVDLPEGVLFYHRMLWMSHFKSFLIFNRNEFEMKISMFEFGNNFDNNTINKDILTIPRYLDGRHEMASKSCLSYNSELLATISLRSTDYNIARVTVDLIAVFKNERRFQNLKFLEHKEIQIKSNARFVFDCELVSNGEKLILVLYEASRKLFVCCSTQPLRKLFTTKIACNHNRGWCFVHDEEDNDLLVTVLDGDGQRDTTIQLFSFTVDSFLLVHEFRPSSLGIKTTRSLFVRASNKTLFIVNDCMVYVLGCFRQEVFVKYRLQLTDIQSVKRFIDVDVDYNGVEIVISRRLRLDDCSLKIFVNIFYTPLLNPQTLFELSKLVVLESYSKDDIKELNMSFNIPNLLS